MSEPDITAAFETVRDALTGGAHYAYGKRRPAHAALSTIEARIETLAEQRKVALYANGELNNELAALRAKVERLTTERDLHEEAWLASEQEIARLRAERDGLRAALVAVYECPRDEGLAWMVNRMRGIASAALARHPVEEGP